MPMLDAALAFALTMLAVASVVTAVVGKLAASATYRRQLFLEQLQTFYARHVREVVEERLDVAADRADAEAKRVLAGLMEELSLQGKVEVSTRELLSRLSASALGERLKAKAGGEAAQLGDRLGAAWERLGEDFSEKFRARARLASFATGIVVAAVLNIDSIHIVESYLTSDEARAEVLGQQDAMLQQYAAFLDGRADADAATVAAAREDLQAIRADVDALLAAGLPLGWDHAPWAGCPNASGWLLPRCGGAAASSLEAALWVWSLWVLGVLVTGYLAGLGAPFWYDLVSGLNHLAQNRRGSKRRNVGETEAASPTVQGAAAG